VLVDDKPEAVLRREDGFLWVVLSPGVHRVRVEGLLPNVGEWQWTYLLKPRQVRIEAPGWNVTGVRANGVPDQQVFFTPQQKASAAETTYDRQDLQPAVAVTRQLELGLTWQIRTTVRRLVDSGKAVALRLPLLPGENVVSAGALIGQGFIEVRLGARDRSFTWSSQLPITDALTFADPRRGHVGRALGAQCFTRSGMWPSPASRQFSRAATSSYSQYGSHGRRKDGAGDQSPGGPRRRYGDGEPRHA
jgi:hypothetical protein